MGCDIHLHIEVKLNGQWEHYSHPYIDRHYDLFAKMAGVRNYCGIIPISELKGLPQNLSRITRVSAKGWENDGHSHSWFDIKEIRELEEWWQQEQDRSIGLEWDVLHCYLFGNSFSGVKDYPDEYPKGITDVRFVFWFDN